MMIYLTITTQQELFNMIQEKLKTVDPAICGLASTDGTVWLSPGLQGRIFCSIGEELTHKLDFELAAHPTDGFNNIGGNSFWPGPEGGAFAYNYPHGEWTVQDGINKVRPSLTVESAAAGVMVKNITMQRTASMVKRPSSVVSPGLIPRMVQILSKTAWAFLT